MAEAAKATEAERISSRSVPHPFVIGASIAGVLFAAFLALGAARQAYFTSTFDSTLVTLVHGSRFTSMTTWMIWGTQLGSFAVAVMIAAVVVTVLLFKRMWTAAALVVLVLGVGYLWGQLAQLTIRRVRPPQLDALIPIPTAFSYPSGHSITALLLYGAIAFLVWRTVDSRVGRVLTLAACVALIVFVGFTRVYLGVHWPSDVVGAWLLGGAWLSLIAGLYVAWEKHLAETR